MTGSKAPFRPLIQLVVELRLLNESLNQVLLPIPQRNREPHREDGKSASRTRSGD